jgi:hypothetical protein
VNAVSFAEQGDVEVIVDHEDGARGACEVAEAARQQQQLPSGEVLVAELEDVCAPAQGGAGEGGDAAGVLIRGDYVEAGGEEPLEEEVSRS